MQDLSCFNNCVARSKDVMDCPVGHLEDPNDTRKDELHPVLRGVDDKEYKVGPVEVVQKSFENTLTGSISDKLSLIGFFLSSGGGTNHLLILIPMFFTRPSCLDSCSLKSSNVMWSAPSLQPSVKRTLAR